MSKATCWKCGAPVLWLPTNGVRIAIEPCAPGTGDIALQRQIDGSETALATTGGRYQRHSVTCKRPSFVGSAPERKVRL